MITGDKLLNQYYSALWTLRDETLQYVQDWGIPAVVRLQLVQSLPALSPLEKGLHALMDIQPSGQLRQEPDSKIWCGCINPDSDIDIDYFYSMSKKQKEIADMISEYVNLNDKDRQRKKAEPFLRIVKSDFEPIVRISTSTASRVFESYEDISVTMAIAETMMRAESREKNPERIPDSISGIIPDCTKIAKLRLVKHMKRYVVVYSLDKGPTEKLSLSGGVLVISGARPRIEFHEKDKANLLISGWQQFPKRQQKSMIPDPDTTLVLPSRAFGKDTVYQIWFK